MKIDNKKFDELVDLYVVAKISKQHILNYFKISQTIFYRKMKKKGYSVETHYYSKKIGYISRDSIFWEQAHKKYLDGASIKKIEEESGIDAVTILRTFRKLGLEIRDLKIGIQIGNETRKKITKEKYGNENFFKTAEFKQKSKKTFIEHFGVDHPWKCKEIIKKMQIVWGKDNPFQIEKVKKIITLNNIKLASIRRNESLKKLGFELLEKYAGLRFKDSNRKLYKIKHLCCCTVFYDDLVYDPKCPKCHVIRGTSLQEIEVADYIRSLSKHQIICGSKRHILSRKTNRHYQIDILIPEINVGFEYNGTFYHSTIAGTDKDFHQYKTEKALEKGIKLYHIWEYDDKDITKYRIKRILEGLKVDISEVHNNVIKVNRDWCPDFKDSIHYTQHKFLGYSKPICHKVDRFECYNSGEVQFEQIA